MAQRTYEIDGETYHLHYSMARLEAAEQAAGCSAFEIVAGMSQNRTPRIAVVKVFFAYGLMNSGGVYAPLKKATAFAEKELESSGYVTVTGEVYEQLAEDCGFLFQ